MGDSGLGELHLFFDVAGAEAWLCGGVVFAVAQRLEDAAAGGIGDGVEGAVEKLVGGHGVGIPANIDECQCDRQLKTIAMPVVPGGGGNPAERSGVQ